MKVKRLYEEALLPTKATEGSAAITTERCYRNMSINEFAKLLGITEEKLKKIEDGGYNT